MVLKVGQACQSCFAGQCFIGVEQTTNSTLATFFRIFFATVASRLCAALGMLFIGGLPLPWVFLRNCRLRYAHSENSCQVPALSYAGPFFLIYLTGFMLYDGLPDVIELLGL